MAEEPRITGGQALQAGSPDGVPSEAPRPAGHQGAQAAASGAGFGGTLSGGGVGAWGARTEAASILGFGRHAGAAAELREADAGARGPAIVGLFPRFADSAVEDAYREAQRGRSRRQLFYILVAAALIPAISVAVALAGGLDDRADVVFFGPALTQLAACLGFGLALWRTRERRTLRFLALGFGIFYLAIRCAGIDGLPALAESSAAMVIGTILLLYCLPLPLGQLAPLLTVGSAVMLAAWIGRAQRPPNAAIVQMSEWVTMANLVGLMTVRMHRLAMRQLWAQAVALHHMATHDGLTGVANRRHFETVLACRWQSARATGLPVSLILLDVDHFKLLNDGIGHHAGDSCLRDLTQILQTALTEPGEFLARVGGEEFAILLPGRDPTQAGAAARRVIAAVREARIAHPCSPVGPHLTVSLGVATAWPATGTCAWELTSLADRLVYAAKAGGRNCLRQDTMAETRPARGVVVSAS